MTAKRQIIATLLCAALASAVNAQNPSLSVYGNVTVGLYYTNVEHGDSSLVMAGLKQAPDDSYIGIRTQETLSNGLYAGVQLEGSFGLDDGTMSSSKLLFDRVARLYVGNGSVEMSLGRLSGFTVAGQPYSVYGKTRANMTMASLGGIAPANITFQPDRLNNAIAIATTANKGVFLQGLFSNGGDGIYSPASSDPETEYDWSDNRHVGQLAVGWVGDNLRSALVYSFEMPGNTSPDSTITHKNPSHAVHWIASYDFGGPAVSGILFWGKNNWRLGPSPDMHSLLGQGDAAKGLQALNRSENGADVMAAYMSAVYPWGNHNLSAAAGFLHAKWKGNTDGIEYDQGNMWMTGVVYRYYLSKRTHFYAATSYSDGEKLLGTVARYNQTMATVGLMTRF